MQNSPTGDCPVGWQEAVLNSVADAVKFLVKGVVAIGTYILDA